MQIRGRRSSEFLADELTIAAMAKAIRNIDFSDDAARNLAYRDAGIPVEKTCGLNDDAVRIARIYRDRIARPRAAREILSCVLAAALLSPSVASAEPFVSAEGTAALAEALGWARVIFTHVLAASLGALLMAFGAAAGRDDRSANRDNAGTLE